MREEIAMICLTAIGISALAMGRDEGILMTILNAITAVILVAQKKSEK